MNVARREKGTTSKNLKYLFMFVLSIGLGRGKVSEDMAFS
jgi:hypothetical protein